MITAGEIASGLRDVLPVDVVVDDVDRLTSFTRDHSRFTAAEPPAALVLPRCTEQVSATMRFAHEHRVPVVPRGLGSGLAGGANTSPGSIVLSLQRMTELLRLDKVNGLAVVQPGLITGDLRRAAERQDLYYPPDPGSVEFCSIGGNIATNAGGMCCVKYGVTGDFVLGLEVVLADGRVLRTGTETIKGVAGYNLTQLFVGSEGTLGVVTEATLRLVPLPPTPHTLVASFSTTVEAGRCVVAIKEGGGVPSLMELLDSTTVRAVDQVTRMGIGEEVAALLLVQSDSPAAADAIGSIAGTCQRNGALDVIVTDDPSEGYALLEARRQALPALERLGDCLLDDVAVPISRVGELLGRVHEISDDSGVTIGMFGHAGDGNFHPTIIFDADDPASDRRARDAFAAVTQAALDLGGTITGEHGIGELKREWLESELGATSLATHRSLKRALDPRWVLNPNKVFAP